MYSAQTSRMKLVQSTMVRGKTPKYHTTWCDGTSVAHENSSQTSFPSSIMLLKNDPFRMLVLPLHWRHLHRNPSRVSRCATRLHGTWHCTQVCVLWINALRANQSIFGRTSLFSISRNWTGPSSSIPIASGVRTVFCGTINMAGAIEKVEIQTRIYFGREMVSNESEMTKIKTHSI